MPWGKKQTERARDDAIHNVYERTVPKAPLLKKEKKKVPKEQDPLDEFLTVIGHKSKEGFIRTAQEKVNQNGPNKEGSGTGSTG